MKDTRIPRETKQPHQSRAALVSKITADVRAARARWQPAFDRMQRDIAFANGAQWPGMKPGRYDEADDRYVANVILRAVNQRVASLYARDPRVVCRRKPRLMATVWDGTQMGLTEALQRVAMNPLDYEAQMILSDVRSVRDHDRMIQRISRTLELLFHHELQSQPNPFKQSIKATLRRACIAGVGWVKLGFQRIMAPKPDTERAIADATERLATLQRIADDYADEQIHEDQPEVEQLRLMIADLARQPEMIVREGLSLDYPESDAIIPDPNCRSLRGFIGCEWVAEQFLLTPERVEEIWGADLRTSGFLPYDPRTGMSPMIPETSSSSILGPDGARASRMDGKLCCVWVVYNRSTGLIYCVADGHSEFLCEPATPDVQIEGFWPWLPVVLNDSYNPGDPWPLSDVALMRDMQRELNRNRQGLREHRIANRPKLIAAAGALTKQDRENLATHPANAIIELQALQPGQSVEALLQPMRLTGVDPNLYDPSPSFQDILRVVGSQEANIGGVSGATATETSIAEASRSAAVSSAVDDLDSMLTQLARLGGQILLLNVSEETVQRIVGPGAVWPQTSLQAVSEEIYLDVQAGSAGAPNQARDMQQMTQAMPVLMQLPGLSHEWLARLYLQRLGADLDLTEAFAEGAPSIAAQNRKLASQLGGGNDPAAQGDRGADNGPQPPDTSGGEGPRMDRMRDTMEAGGGGIIAN